MKKKQIEEISVVKKYLHNGRLDFKERDIKPNIVEDSPIDVFWKSKRFQIRQGDDKNIAKRIKMVKKYQKAKEKNNEKEMAKNFFQILSLRDPDEIFKEIIIEPAVEKINKYLNQARGITLLVNSDLDYSHPLWIKDELENYRMTGEEIFDKSKNFFDEIYLVCPSENIKIYPLLSTSK